MSFKILLFLAIIAFIAYRVNRAWQRFKKIIQDVREVQKKPKTKVVHKDNLTIIYPESSDNKRREFKGGEYIEFEEK